MNSQIRVFNLVKSHSIVTEKLIESNYPPFPLSCSTITLYKCLTSFYNNPKDPNLPWITILSTQRGHSNILNSEIHVFILYLDTFLQYMFILSAFNKNLEKCTILVTPTQNSFGSQCKNASSQLWEEVDGAVFTWQTGWGKPPSNRRDP